MRKYFPFGMKQTPLAAVVAGKLVITSSFSSLGLFKTHFAAAAFVSFKLWSLWTLKKGTLVCIYMQDFSQWLHLRSALTSF